MDKNVCHIVVPANLCVGCGLCAGVCPAKTLEMRTNDFGEYIPVDWMEGCLEKCTLCFDVCPFYSQAENENTLAKERFGDIPGIRHSIETGYVLDCYVGYSKVHHQRQNGSSGGLASWFLERLLDTKVVDYVVCVSSSSNPDELFQYSIVDTAEAVRSASKSAYYPVNLSSAIRFITKNNARYAITGLPCFLKGIRLAMKRHRLLRERIVALVGLTCGQSKSKSYSEYLTALGGGDPERISKLQFRVKDPQRPISDYGFSFETISSNGEAKAGKIFWGQGMGEAWRNGYFKLAPCNYCDDVFGEVADVSFMDAWLPEYLKEGGYSLLINRNPDFRKIWDEEIPGNNLWIRPIDLNKVIESQSTQIEDKREGMQHRLYEAAKRGETLPQKRWEPRRENNFIKRKLLSLRVEAAKESRRAWAPQKSIENFNLQVNNLRNQLRIMTYIYWSYRFLLKKYQKLQFANRKQI